MNFVLVMGTEVDDLRLTYHCGPWAVRAFKVVKVLLLCCVIHAFWVGLLNLLNTESRTTTSMAKGDRNGTFIFKVSQTN